MKKLLPLVLCFALLIGSSGNAFAATISYQGKLTDTNGPVTSPIDMVVRIFDTAVGGNLLYEENHTDVEIVNGIFNIQLGGANGYNDAGVPIDISTVVLASTPLWLEISVIANTPGPVDTLAPRTEITPTATAILASEADYAVEAGNADMVDGKHAADFALKSELLSSGSGVQVAWGNLVNLPVELLDGDNDTLNSLNCTDGQIAKWNSVASSWQCQDDSGSVAWVDGPGQVATVDKVGIGTAVPEEQLHVNGNLKVSSGNVELRSEGYDPYIELTSNDAGDSTSMRIKTLDAIGFAVTDDANRNRLVVPYTGGLLSEGAFDTGSAVIPAENGGTRMMWYPEKAAFRTGRVLSDQWNDVNIGQYSNAMGYNSMASGYSSTAIGPGAKVSGDYATSIGYNTNANGSASIALGYNAVTSINQAIAIGNRATASGYGAATLGNDTKAKSAYETVVGRFNTDYTPASTISWNDADRLFVIGKGTGVGAESDAMVVLKSGDTTINGALTATSFTGSGAGLTNVAAETASSVSWANVTGRPTGLDDGDDVNDADADSANELQTLEIKGNLLSISNGNEVDLSLTGYDTLADLNCGDGEIAIFKIGSGWFCGTTPPDNLGNHTATQNIILGSNYLSGDGDSEGILVDSTGLVGIGAPSPGAKFHVSNSDVAQAAYFTNTNAANNLPALYANTVGPGQSIFGLNQGTGRAGHFQIFNAASSASALRAETNGTGYAGEFLGNVNITGNVGIGTSSPTDKLTVSGAVKSESGGFIFPDQTAQTTAAFGDGHSLDGDSGGPIDALYVDGTGNVGIGTSSPTDTLQVEGSLQVRPFNYIYNHVGSGIGWPSPRCPCDTTTVDVDCPIDSFLTNIDKGAECYDYYTLNHLPSGPQGHWIFEGASAQPLIQTQESGDLTFGVAPSSKVGIGDEDPVSMLDVTGDFTVKPMNYEYVYDSLEPGWKSPRCSCDLEVGVDTLAYSNGNDCSEFSTNQDEGAECYDRYYRKYLGIWLDPFSRKFTRLDGASNPALYVGENGRVGIGTKSPAVELDVIGSINYTGTLNGASDQRLKENITPITNALNLVDGINGVYYNKIATPDRIEAGVIAQDVQTVLPEAVSVIDWENGYLGVSYNMLIPVLIEAVKELKAENDSLKMLVCQDLPEDPLCQ